MHMNNFYLKIFLKDSIKNTIFTVYIRESWEDCKCAFPLT